MVSAICLGHHWRSQLALLLTLLTIVVEAQAASPPDPVARFLDPPSNVSWWSSTNQTLTWGSSPALTWELAAAQCKKSGGHLLRMYETSDHNTTAGQLTSTFWLALNTSAIVNVVPKWASNASWQALSTDQNAGGFWRGGASVARVKEPWCAAIRYPAVVNVSNSMAAVNCTTRSQFFCSFNAVNTSLSPYGLFFKLDKLDIFASYLFMTWADANTWCSTLGGAMLDFTDHRLKGSNVADLLARIHSLPLPSALYPPGTSTHSTPPMSIWIGLGKQACTSQEASGGGVFGGTGTEVTCTWQGGGAVTFNSMLPSTLQYSSILSFKPTCTAVNPTDMFWDPLTSCLESRQVVCQADHTANWTGYTEVHKQYQYAFFSRPATRTIANIICNNWNSTVLRLPSDNEEQEWLAQAASIYTRNQPLMMTQDESGTTPYPGFWAFGRRHPNDSTVFEGGVWDQVKDTKELAFVCKRVAPPSARRSPPPPAIANTTNTNTTAANTPGSFSPSPKPTPKKSSSTYSPSILTIFAITAAAGTLLAACLTALGLFLRRSSKPSSTPPPTKAKELPIFSQLDSTDTNNNSTPIPHGHITPPDSLTSSQTSEFPFEHPTGGSDASPRAPQAAVNTLDSQRVLHVILDSDPEKQLKVFRDIKLGHGAFGAVYKGDYMGVPVAVKTIDVLSMAGLTSTLSGTHSGSESSGCSAEVAALRQELSILSRVQHPNVVKLYGGCLTPPNVLIVMELMEYSLGEYIRRAKQRLPLRTTLQVIRAVAAGLTHLHPNIIHRDLKPQNILLDSTGNVKISDFGVSRVKLATYLTTQHQAAGTIPYMAPECYSSEAVTEKFDIYSLGMVLWECVVGKPPWMGWNAMAIMYHVGCLKVRPDIPTDPQECPPIVAALIERCWAHDPHARPSAEEIVQEINRIEAMLPE